MFATTITCIIHHRPWENIFFVAFEIDYILLAVGTYYFISHMEFSLLLALHTRNVCYTMFGTAAICPALIRLPSSNVA